MIICRPPAYTARVQLLRFSLLVRLINHWTTGPKLEGLFDSWAWYCADSLPFTIFSNVHTHLIWLAGLCNHRAADGRPFTKKHTTSLPYVSLPLKHFSKTLRVFHDTTPQIPYLLQWSYLSVSAPFLWFQKSNLISYHKLNIVNLTEYVHDMFHTSYSLLCHITRSRHMRQSTSGTSSTL